MISRHWPTIASAAISMLPWFLLLAWVHWKAFAEFGNLDAICDLANGTSQTVWGAFDYGAAFSIMLLPVWLIAVVVLSVAFSVLRMKRSRLGPLLAIPVALAAVFYFWFQSTFGAGAEFTKVWVNRCG